jgi:hypothetical protein
MDEFYKTITWLEILTTVTIVVFINFFIPFGALILVLLSILSFILFIIKMRKMYGKIYSRKLIPYMFMPGGTILLYYHTFNNLF